MEMVRPTGMWGVVWNGLKNIASDAFMQLEIDPKKDKGYRLDRFENPDDYADDPHGRKRNR